jgi:hypothetical protein
MRSKRSLIPLRGSTEDWGPGKYQRNLEGKAEYSRRMQKRVEEGPPDFEKLLSTGVAPAAGAPARAGAVKAKKKPAPPPPKGKPSAARKKARRK